MSSDKDSCSNKISFSKTQKASDDLFRGLLTEDNTASGPRILDVMFNDQGSGRSLYSLDDDSNRPKDLLTQDLGRSEPLSTDKSAMGATIWITNDGKVGYDASSFSAATLAKLNHLSAGESLTDTFTYAVRLSDGTLSWATASVKIDGANDPVVITSGAQNGAVTEMADGSLGENTATLTSSGAITFTDADRHDSHTVSFAPNGAGYLGTFKAYLADDDDDRHDDGDRRGGDDHRGDDRNDSNSSDGAVKWKFAVNDSAVDHLVAGETLTQTYNVVISDGHGGTTTQVVTITLTGTNNAPVITSAAQSGSVSEGDDGANMTATGHITFADVDLIDSHALTVSVAATHGAAGVDADGTWHYTVNDTGAVDALAAGAHLADSFTVQVDDHHGGIVTQVVSIDIVGTNDAAIIAGVDTRGLIETDAVLTTGGTLTISDVDSATIFQAQTGVAGSNGYGSFTIGTDGTWSYATNTAHNEFQDGVTYTDTLTVKSADDTTHTLTVNIVGSNDAAVLSADVVALTEGDTATPISTSGTLTISDVDSAQTFVAQAGTAGNYGTFAVDTDGAWTYTASSAHNEFADGTTYHETFNVVSADGTDTSVKINILGTNDAPDAVADTNALDAVVESGAIQPTATSGLVGTWLGEGAPFSVLSLFADGRYMYMEGDGQAPNGGEAGTWIYDAAAGKLALNGAFDNNIGGGLAPDQNGIFNPVTFNAAQIGLTIFNPDLNATVTLVGARQAVSTGIAGTWVTSATADEPFTTLVLFDDNRFMYMEGAGLPPNGLEAGTYTYDPLSGALTFTTTFDNNNDGSGSGGLSPNGDGITFTAVINGDTLDVSNGDFHFPALSRQFSGTQIATIDPAFAGDATAVGNVLANDTDVDAGAIRTVSAVNGVAGNVGATIVGTYGTVVINSDGSYTYTLDNTDADTNALAQGASATDVFNYTVKDEFGATSSSTLTVAVTGTNDAPVAVNDTGSATEKGGIANGAGGSNATGNVLANDADADSAHASLTVTAIRTGFTEGIGAAGVVGGGTGLVGAHGTLFMNTNGGYSYVVKQFDPAVQALNSTGPNTSLTDVFNYTVSDGSRTDTAVLTINIHGANDAAVLSSAVVAVTEGDTAAAIGASGHLTISDVDSAAAFHAQARTVGHYGTFSIDAGGAWTYAADSAHNEFADGTTYHEAFDVVSADGTHTSVKIDILGTDDAPVVTAPVTLPAIAEDSGAHLITQAELLAHASDIDGPGSLAATGLAISSGSGALVDNGDGTWSFTPAHNDDTAVTFSYGVTDGVAPAVAASATLDITPVNDVATISGAATGSVAEDGTLTAGGIMTVADVDTGENHFQTPGSLSGIYGDFTFDATSGVWGYTLNNGAANVQALNASDVMHDTMVVNSADGTASQTIDVTIGGAAEAPAGIGLPLAVAYYDRDANNVYDAASDTLYFGVFDTNGDGAVSAGDTLRADFYPADVAASSLFEFQNKDHVITGADWSSAGHVLFVAAGNEFVGFYEGSDAEEVVNYNNFGPELALLDAITGAATGPFAAADEAYAGAGWAAASTLMPTGPQTATDSLAYQLGNQHWLNVDLLI